MTLSYNKLILAGNLTQTPEMNYLPSQTPVVNCGIAVNRKFKDKSGNEKQETCFIDFNIFGKQAEIFKQYAQLGGNILLEGTLKLDQWTDREGIKRSKHTMVAERFQFIGAPKTTKPEPEPERPQRPEPEFSPDIDDGIPF